MAMMQNLVWSQGLYQMGGLNPNECNLPRYPGFVHPGISRTADSQQADIPTP